MQKQAKGYEFATDELLQILDDSEDFESDDTYYWLQGTG